MLVSSEERCCGCGACQCVCPKSAIVLSENEEGFLYPTINEELCVDCKLCLRSCPLQDPVPRNIPISAYAAVSSDAINSASGGVAAALMKGVVDDNGFAFGAAMDFDNGVPLVHHIQVHSESELSKLRGSKYVQSVTVEAFQRAKVLLDSGDKVIFTGTPCQIAGLKAFLKKDYDNLLLVDLVCHGVPSPKMFRDYIARLSLKMGEVTQFRFRDKSYGWGHVGSISVGRKKKAVHSEESSFFTLFLKGEILRKSCYSCAFSNMERVGDLTLGDYWGIEIAHPELLKKNGGILMPEKGCSCILVNSEKGQEWMKHYGKNLFLYKSPPAAVAQNNGCLNHPIPYGKHRDNLFRQYKTDGYCAAEEVYSKFYRPSIVARLKLHCPNAVKKMYHRLKP